MELIDKLANNSLLGLLLALAILGLIFEFKLILNEKDKRIQDAKEARDAIVEPLKSIRMSLDFLARKKNG